MKGIMSPDSSNNDNVVVLSVVREHMKQYHRHTNGGGRGTVRFDCDERAFVQLTQCIDNSRLDFHAMIPCRVLNISSSGVQIESKEPITSGVLLELWIELESYRGRFFLTGKVRWSQERNENGKRWLIGVQLIETNDSDYGEWLKHCRHLDQI